MTIHLLIIFFSIFLGLLFALDLSIPIPHLKIPEKNKKRVFRMKIVSEIKNKVQSMLSVSGSRMTIRNYFEISAVLFISGFAGGLLYNNLLISLALAFGLPFLQFQMLLKKKNDRVRGHNAKLEIYMSMVTSSYLQSNDIEAAIIDSYNRMDQSSTEARAAAKPFGYFIGQAAGNANITECILAMKSDIDNKYFWQWCDKLALCHENASLKPVLPYVINRMRRKRTLDMETVTNCHKHYKDFVKISIICLFFTLFVPLTQPSWRYIVTATAVGKLLTAMVLIVVFIAAAYVVKVNRPVGERT